MKTSHFLFSTLLLILFAFTSCFEPDGPDINGGDIPLPKGYMGFEVKGVVYDDLNDPLENVRVNIQLRAGAQSGYVFTDAAGQYDLSCALPLATIDDVLSVIVRDLGNEFLPDTARIPVSAMQSRPGTDVECIYSATIDLHLTRK